MLPLSQSSGTWTLRVWDSNTEAKSDGWFRGQSSSPSLPHRSKAKVSSAALRKWRSIAQAGSQGIRDRPFWRPLSWNPQVHSQHLKNKKIRQGCKDEPVPTRAFYVFAICLCVCLHGSVFLLGSWFWGETKRTTIILGGHPDVFLVGSRLQKPSFRVKAEAGRSC